ncbi:MAG TPA: VOC family protein [Acidobacteriaceae bacterium]|nr:VOC family protein [Acidobacteriaceae bacterium]
MKLSTHLGFNGNCNEAMKFYATTFGGTVNFTMTWAESPMCDQVGPEFQDKIMHQSLTVGDTLLMGADSPPGRFQTAQGIVVSIAVDTPEDADRVFAALSEGGNITMPIQETFWAKRFGMCTDRFGIPWMVNCEKPMTA